ncbi:hypothetical protein D7X33_05205 [Butyricicoccus sp. 1XD8-22]|nr:hypothetical protein D7X33_05205 [Butyricicoccus sp. 1XD8-22]
MNRWNPLTPSWGAAVLRRLFEEGQARFPAAAASRICGIPAAPLFMGEGTCLAGARRAPVRIA